jgi:two-component system, chemotaxis family, chemotaxis protein CheY
MKTILVVEDFVAVQLFLREMLESKGYRTLGATNGGMAYEVMTSHAHLINLVLTDYHMPDSNGFELLRKIKTNRGTEKIPVIFLTTESDPQIKKNVAELGFVSWIKKPYRSEVLFAEVEKALNKRINQGDLFLQL